MRKQRILLEITSILMLVVPNLIFMLCNLKILKEANVIALTMLALVVISVIGLGTLVHFKVKAGIWLLILGVFMLIMSNMSYVGGIALIIEGVGLALDGYVMKPLVTRLKIRELEENGQTVSYTRPID